MSENLTQRPLRFSETLEEFLSLDAQSLDRELCIA